MKYNKIKIIIHFENVILIILSILIFRHSLFSQTNSLQWVVPIKTSTSNVINLQNRSITADDATGNVLLTIKNRYSGPSEDDTLFYNINSAGNTLSTQTVECVDINLCGGIYGSQITKDANGNIFLVGQYSGIIDLGVGSNVFQLDTANSATDFIVKYNSSGVPQWQLSRKYFPYMHYVYDIQTDNVGNLYVAGAFNFTKDFDPGNGNYQITATGATGDAFLLKLNSNGGFEWVAYLNTPEGSIARNIAIDSDGNINICGQFWGKAMIFNSSNILVDSLFWQGNNDAFLLKFSPSGALLNKLYFGNTANDFLLNLVCDNNGNTYATGKFSTNNIISNAGNFNLSSDSNLVFMKLNTSYQVNWLKYIGSMGSLSLAYGITFIPAINSLVLVGAVSSLVPIDFDPSNATFELTPWAYDGFVAQYSANDGSFQCAFLIGGRGTNSSGFNDYAFAVDNAEGNYYYVYGWFSDTTDFEPGNGEYNLITNINGINEYFGYLAKYDASICSSTISVKPEETTYESFKIYPNPALNFLHLSGEKKITDIVIIDIAGKIVLNQNIYDNYAQILVEYLPSGFYTCLIRDTDNNITIKKFALVKY